MSCEFCNRAFEDAVTNIVCGDNFKDLFESSRTGLLGNTYYFAMRINDYGAIEVEADCDGDNYTVIGAKKIKYCPMCGAEIPETTVTKKQEIALGYQTLEDRYG